MRAFVEWALGPRYRLVLLALAFLLVFPLVSTALLVLDTLRRGPPSAVMAATATTAALAVIDLAAGGGLSWATGLGGLALALGVAMGVLLRSTKAIGLAFQGIVLAAMGVAAFLTFLAPDPETLVSPIRQQLLESMRAWGGQDAQLALIREWDPVLLMGSVIALVMMFLSGALLLGAWCFSLTSETVSFGKEFRQLALGRVLGLGSMLVLALSMGVDLPVVENLAAIAMSAFLFQGLAVMHAWAHAKKWHWGALAGVYVTFLVTPLNILTVFALCATGLLDNIFALRAPLGRQA